LSRSPVNVVPAKPKWGYKWGQEMSMAENTSSAC
jgi:hypothetical protein